MIRDHHHYCNQDRDHLYLDHLDDHHPGICSPGSGTWVHADSHKWGRRHCPPGQKRCCDIFLPVSFWSSSDTKKHLWLGRCYNCGASQWPTRAERDAWWRYIRGKHGWGEDCRRHQQHQHRHRCHHVDSIAVSLFGNMTVEPGEIHIITKDTQYQNKRSK